MPVSNLTELHDYMLGLLNENDADQRPFVEEEVRKAARQLEMKYNWQHMHGQEQVTFTVAAPNVTFDNNLKRPDLLWEVKEGRYCFYQIRDPWQTQELDDDPTFFFWAGRTLQPNFEVTQDLVLQMSRWRYTVWPAFDQLPAIVELYEDMVLHHAMVRMGRVLKDPEILQAHAPLAESALQDALDAESEFQLGGHFEFMKG